MQQLESPPEIVEQARERAAVHGVFNLIDPVPASARSSADAAVAELREKFPHLDDATLVLFCDYVASMAYGVMRTEPSLKVADSIKAGFSLMAMRIGFDLVKSSDQAA